MCREMIAPLMFQDSSAFVLAPDKIVVILERSEWVWRYSYRVWRDQLSVEGPSQGALALIPTHEVGITHTLEHMSESINNTM